MEKFIFIALVSVVHRITAKDVIYKLDAEQMSRFPLKNSLDRFDPCVERVDGVFCTAHADLVSDEPSELLDMIQAYSAHDVKHYNYSNIMYGLCITSTCKQFYDGDDSQEALWRTTEACLNDSLNRDHGLKARITDMYCYRHGQTTSKDNFDYFVAVVLLALLGLNVVGTVYDYLIREEDEPGNKILMAFAIRANWNRFTAPPSKHPREIQLMPLNGIRFLCSILVILGHIPVFMVYTVDNTAWLEWAYRNPMFHFAFQGHLIVQCFFVLSGFMLAYSLERVGEKQKITLNQVPKTIFLRWIRLSSAQMPVLLLTASWLRHVNAGPFWWGVIGTEWNDCRNFGWYNVFFMSNLINNSTCNLEVWSSASDMQLFIIGLMVSVLASKRTRPFVLIGLFAFAHLWGSYKIYTKDLEGTLLVTPTAFSTFFISSDSFNLIYKGTSVNMPAYVMGMALGFLVYILQKNDLIKGDYSKYRYLHFLTSILMVALSCSGGWLFFQDAPRASMMTRLLYGPVIKTLFIVNFLLFLLGNIYRANEFVAHFLSNPAWTVMSRISYCIYLTHVSWLRHAAGTARTLSSMSLFNMALLYLGVIVLTLMSATLLHLLVESPVAELVNIYVKSTIQVKQKSVQGTTANETAASKVTANETVDSKATANGTAASKVTANGISANGTGTNSLHANGFKANGIKTE